MFKFTDSERISGGNISDLTGNSFGYIVLPKDIERDSYIKQCTATNKVFVFDNILNAFIGEVMISDQVLNDVEFPTDVNSFGSAVIITYLNKTATPVITGTMNNKKNFNALDEASFKFSKSFNGALVEILGNSKTGELSINTVGGKSASTMNINVLGRNDSTLNINVAGRTKLKSSKQILIEDSNGNAIEISEKNISLTDTFKNTVKLSDKGIVLTVGYEKKVLLGSDGSDKSSVIGEELVSIINDILSAIQTMTVPTPAGPSGVPVNAIQFKKIEANVKNILSKIVFLK